MEIIEVLGHKVLASSLVKHIEEEFHSHVMVNYAQGFKERADDVVRRARIVGSPEHHLAAAFIIEKFGVSGH